MTNLREENRERARKMGLIFFPAFDWAITPTHPEREERLLYTRDQIFEEGLMDLPRSRSTSRASRSLRTSPGSISAYRL